MTVYYDKYKRKLYDDYGFSFGFDYNVLFQTVTHSLDKNSACGEAFRVYGEWSHDANDASDRGALVYKADYRRTVGTVLAPGELGIDAGYAGVTGRSFTDAGWALRNLYWVQHLYGDRAGFVIGIVDVTDYVDVYGFTNPWTDFSNAAFANTPTIPTPGQGFGAAARFTPTDHIYLVAGIADANGDPTAPADTFDSIADQGEFFSHIEMGWVFSWARRYTDNIHLTAWHADARTEAEVEEGWGMAFSFCRIVDEVWEPFLRTGFADNGGAMWSRSVSAGTGYHFSDSTSELGVGLNWSRPAADVFGPGLSDQYTGELYYRFQVLKMVSITPDVQLLVNPALNPKSDTMAVFGLRGRLNF